MDLEIPELTTTAEVIDALGGVGAVAALTGRKYGAAFNWKGFVKFPADTYVVMQEELRSRNFAASPSLWGMVASQSSRETSEART